MAVRKASLENMGINILMESLMIDKGFWKNKRVLVTGHTGFKGTWLCLWLSFLGAKVTGYALNPPTEPSLFALCHTERLVKSVLADVRESDLLSKTMLAASPEIVIHMAAQPLVRESYKDPAQTYAVNIIGTVNLLEAVRKCSSVKTVINVTTDKCYENKEWFWGYRENDPLGGYDPYSCSKACSELVTLSYRNSFFNPADYHIHGVGIASARAGNVIGGGDWAKDRLIPDCIRSLLKGEKITARNPGAVRPWQHVLEPLGGYLLLAQKLYENGPDFSGGWNFGPDDSDARPVWWVVKKICEKWDRDNLYETDKGIQPHEARYLKLDCSKAKNLLGWYPRWRLDKAIDKIVEWTKAYKENRNVKAVCLQQIKEYSRCKTEV